MNGYELLAQSYEAILQREPDMETESKEDLKRKIANFRFVAEKTEEDINDLFATGAFNDICKGYVKKAMGNCGLEEETCAAVMEELRHLLDTMTAQDAREC